MTTDSINPDPTSEKFFEEWQLYQAVIEHDYMFHRPIADSLKEAVQGNMKAGQRILDLGCGDGHIVREALSPLGRFSYTGVDQSRQALNIARDNFENLGWEQHMVQANLADWLEEAQGNFDLILAGFSLHHFYGDKLSNILKNTHRLLNEDGILIVYDILSRPDEDGGAFNQRLLTYADAHWMRLTPEQLRAVREHVEPNDYPLDLDAWTRLLKAAGFSEPALRYHSPNELYALLEMRKSRL